MRSGNAGEGTQSELLDFTVNYEGLIFRRGRIHPRSFVRDIDAAHYRRRSRYAAFVMRNYLGRRTVRLSDAIWVIDNFSPRSYYHWMTECLPRLLVAEGLGASSRLILPANYQLEPYVIFTLDAFPAIKAVEWVGKSTKVAVRRLVCPPRVAPPGEHSAELVAVADRVSAKVEGEGPRRLYLRRGGLARRRIVNEDALGRVLEKHGFTLLQINPADPAQQIRFARSAEIIVGVHGAELTNIMFQRRGSQIVELRHRDDSQFWNCYEPLAERVGVGYQSLRCDVAPGQEKFTDGYEVNHANLLVDIGALEEIVATTAARIATGT